MNKFQELFNSKFQTKFGKLQDRFRFGLFPFYHALCCRSARDFRDCVEPPSGAAHPRSTLFCALPCSAPSFIHLDAPGALMNRSSWARWWQWTKTNAGR